MRYQLAPVIEFAEEWHKGGKFNVCDLPARVNAEIVRVHGDQILGFSYIDEDGRAIVMNLLIEPTEYWASVLCHEGAHHILESMGTYMCALKTLDFKEQVAWYGATLLAIPERMVLKYRRGDWSPGDIVFASGMPYDFVALRLAVDEMIRGQKVLARDTAQHRLDKWMRHLARAQKKIKARQIDIANLMA